MKPLSEIYKTFAMFGICPPIKPISFRIKLLQISILICCITGCFLLLIASAIFIIKNFSTDLTSAISAVFQISGLSNIVYSFILAHIKHDEINDIFDEFQIFYDTSK